MLAPVGLFFGSLHGIVIDQLVNGDSAKPAAEATWTIATSLMTSIATTVIIFGVLFAAAGWLGSPDRLG